MAEEAVNSIDILGLEISSNTRSATEGLGILASSLRSAGSAAGTAERNLWETAAALKEIARAAGELKANNDVATAIQNIVSAVKGFGGDAEKNATGINSIATALTNLATAAKAVGDTVGRLPKLLNAINVASGAKPFMDAQIPYSNATKNYDPDSLLSGAREIKDRFMSNMPVGKIAQGLAEIRDAYEAESKGIEGANPGDAIDDMYKALALSFSGKSEQQQMLDDRVSELNKRIELGEANLKEVKSAFESLRSLNQQMAAVGSPFRFVASKSGKDWFDTNWYQPGDDQTYGQVFPGLRDEYANPVLLAQTILDAYGSAKNATQIDAYTNAAQNLPFLDETVKGLTSNASSGGYGFEHVTGMVKELGESGAMAPDVSAMAEALSRMADALKKFAGMDKIGGILQSISQGIAAISGIGGAGMGDIATMLQTVGDAAGKLANLPEIANALKTVSASGVMNGLVLQNGKAVPKLVASQMDMAWREEEAKNAAWARSTKLDWDKVDAWKAENEPVPPEPIDNTKAEVAQFNQDEDAREWRHTMDLIRDEFARVFKSGEARETTKAAETAAVSEAKLGDAAETTAAALGEVRNAADSGSRRLHPLIGFDPITGKQNYGPAEDYKPFTEPTIAEQQEALYQSRKAWRSMNFLGKETPEAMDKVWLRGGEGAKWRELFGDKTFEQVQAERGESPMQGVAQEAQAAQDATAGVAQEAQNAAAGMGDTAAKAKDAAKEATTMQKVLGGVRAMANSVGQTIKKSIVGQLLRVAKMRALRAVIKSVTSGIKEGISNLYKYSNNINGPFAKAMDNGSSQMLLLKNSLATALAPALEALIPVLTTVVGWVNNLSNVVSQLSALLTGKSTWTKAVLTQKKYGEETKKSSKATKDLLADWDELNIIQNKNSGGGGSGGTDYKKMFEEVSEFDSKLRETATWLQEKAETLKTIAIEIGATILGWKFTGLVTPLLTGLGLAAAKVLMIKNMILGLGLVSVGLTLAWDFGTKFGSGQELSTLDILEAVAAAGVSATGGAVVAKALGWGVAAGAGVGVGLSFIVAATAIYNAATQKVKTEGFTQDTIVKDIVAGVALAIGGTLVALGVGVTGLAAFAVGFGVAVVVTAAVMLNQISTAPLATPEWGNEQWTENEIKKYVESLLKVDVNATIKKVNLVYTNMKNARASVQTALDKLTTDAYPLSLKTKLDSNDVETVKGDVATLVENINTTLDEETKTIYLLASVRNGTSQKGGELSEEDQKLVSSLLLADSAVKSLTEQLQQQITKAYEDGIKNGLSGVDIYEMAAEQIEMLNKIAQAAKQGDAAAQYEMGLERGLAELDLANADEETWKKVADLYAEQTAEAREAAREMAETDFRTMSSKRAEYAAALEDQSLTPEKRAQIQAGLDAADQWLKEYREKGGIEALTETYLQAITGGNQKIKEAIMRVFSLDTISELDLTDSGNKFGSWLYTWLGDSFDPTNMSEQNIAEARAGIYDYVYTLLESVGLSREMLEKFGLDPWELLGADTKEELYATLLGGYGNEMGGMLAGLFGATAEELEKARQLWNSGVKEYRNNNPELLLEDFDFTFTPSDGQQGTEEVREEIEDEVEAATTKPVDATVKVDLSFIGNTVDPFGVFNTPEWTQEAQRKWEEKQHAGAVSRPSTNPQEPGTILTGANGALRGFTAQTESSITDTGYAEALALLRSIQSSSSETAEHSAEIARKDFQPIVKPSSSLGRVVVRAMEMYGETV